MGGEKSMKYVGSWNGWGSPPHGRGKGTMKEYRAQRIGITPAWAGKSFRPTETALPSRDHPRMGGEKIRI